MFARLSHFVLSAAASFFIAAPLWALQDIEEYAVPTLPDIAAVQFIPGKAPIILYNPALCLEAGRALCEFYRYHEYGHIELRHNEREQLTAQEKEREADLWAAKHAPFPSVMAAYLFFSSGRGGTPVHGNSENRAARMMARTENVAVIERSRGAEIYSAPMNRYYAMNPRKDLLQPPRFSALAL